MNNHPNKLPAFLVTPVRVVVIISLIMLLGEYSIMLLIEGVFKPLFQGQAANLYWEFIDSLVLTAIVAPVLYTLVVRPMRKHQVELESELHVLRHKDQLKALIEVIPDAVFLKDGEGRWLITNEAAKQMFRLHHVAWQGKTEMELADMHPEFRAEHERCLASDEEAWQAGHLRVGEEIVVGEDGQSAVVEARKVPIFSKDGHRKGLVVLGRDITERKAAEGRIERLSKLYRALSEVNQAIVRMDEESALFPLVCRTAVDFGGVTMAWIGQLNLASGLIEPAVSYGSGTEYLNSAAIASKGSPESSGPSAIALHENRYVVVNDFQASEITKPWHELASRYGWGSCGAFPITRAGKPFGVFTVYHLNPGAFDAEMIGLLEGMAQDISFAMDSFDRETARRQVQEALRGSERHFRAYFERAMVGMAATSPEKGWLEVNDVMCAMLGYSCEELMQMTWSELTHPDDLAPDELQFNRVLCGEIDEYALDKRFIRKNGTIVYVHLAVRAVRRADGSVDYIVALIEDITNRKLAEQELRIAATAFETQESILITDSNKCILRVNGTFTRLTGYSAGEAIGQTLALLHSGRQDAEFYRSMWETIDLEKYWQGEIWNRRKDGVVFPAWLTITAVPDAEGQVTHYVGAFADLTQHKAAEEKIHQLAFYDPLTKLPNRSLLHDRFSRSLIRARRHAEKTAVLYLDLDNFKAINDSADHRFGDMLLKAVADRLVATLREGDTVARLGGDEFVVILSELDKDESVIQMVEKLLGELSAPFDCAGHKIYTSVSIGVALYPKDGEDEACLLRNAEMAMYRAKAQGRNCFQFFTAELNEYAKDRNVIESDFRNALDRGEFILHFQPQNDLQSGHIFSAEALVRWQHPEMGLIAPSRFILVAEETGLIVPLGKWIMQTACLQARKWHDEGFDIGIAVNLSIRQLRDKGLIDTVKEVLKTSGLEARYLELELTENILIQDTDHVIATLSELKALGIKLSIDDFGTGYSSLGYVKRLPIDRIKIDQSFVRDITTDPEDMVIVEAIIAMAHSLRLRVIAEGVETAEQQMLLRSRKCDETQGYYFCRPLPGEDITEVLRSGRKLELGVGDENKPGLLLLDDDENILNALVRLLRRDGYRILKTTSANEAFSMLATNNIGVIITDQRMKEMSGVDFLRRVKLLHPDTVRIILSGYTELNSVTGAINEGAVYKFLTKPWEDDLLRANISEAFLRYEVKIENVRLARELKHSNDELRRINQELEQQVQQ